MEPNPTHSSKKIKILKLQLQFNSLIHPAPTISNSMATIPNSFTGIRNFHSAGDKTPATSRLTLKPFRQRRSTHRGVGRILQLQSSLAPAAVPLSAEPDDLVASLLSKVTRTDRGVLLPKDEHAKVAAIAQELQRFCVDKPVNCPLIFGEWDVVYCSNPTSPGGGYRSSIGRIFFQTKEMVQNIESPDIVRNKVSFSVLGLFEGEVSLKGKLIVLDEKWIQVVFEPPQLKVGGLELQYGGESEVKLEITYIDENIRLGKGSRGSLFVFQRL